MTGLTLRVLLTHFLIFASFAMPKQSASAGVYELVLACPPHDAMSYVIGPSSGVLLPPGHFETVRMLAGCPGALPLIVSTNFVNGFCGRLSNVVWIWLPRTPTNLLLPTSWNETAPVTKMRRSGTVVAPRTA